MYYNTEVQIIRAQASKAQGPIDFFRIIII